MGSPDQRQEYAIRFSVSPRLFIRFNLLIVIFLALAYMIFSINYLHLGFEFFGSNLLYVLFDLQGEVTIPTWYSSMLLLACSLLLAVVAAHQYQVLDRFRRHWAVLSALFLGLSIDEAADLHGAVSYKLQADLGTSGVLSYPWVIPGIIFTLLVGLAYVPFLAHLPPLFRRKLLLAGLLFVGGALGMEVIEAAYDAATGRTDSVLFLLMVAIEEAMEMAGVIVLISALVAYLGSLANVIRLDIEHR